MSAHKEKMNVLFLCMANSCRSQMARGWAKTPKADCIESFSAGVKPSRLSRRPARVMQVFRKVRDEIRKVRPIFAPASGGSAVE